MMLEESVRRTAPAGAAARPRRAPWLTFLFLIGAFFVIGHEWEYVELRDTGFNLKASEYAEGVEESKTSRRIVLAALAGYGALGLFLVRLNRFTFRSPRSWLVLAFVGWASLSVL